MECILHPLRVLSDVRTRVLVTTHASADTHKVLSTLNPSTKQLVDR